MIEGRSERPVDAFAFGISNGKAILLWGGLIFAIAVPLIAIFWVADELTYSDRMIGLTLAFACLALISAYFVLFMGFTCRCIKTVLGGGTVMPTGLDSPGRLLADGVCGTIIYFEAIVLGFFFLIPPLLLFMPGATGQPEVCLLNAALMFGGLIVFAFVLFMGAIQIVTFADTGSLLDGLNIFRSAGLILTRPADAIVTFIKVVVLFMAFRTVSTILGFLVCLLILEPFVMVVEYAILSSVVTNFYRRSQGRIPEAKPP